MRPNAKQYAKALFELIHDASKEKSKTIIADFSKTLVDNNQASMLKNILRHFEILWNKKEAVADAEIISAHELDGKTLEIVKNYIKKQAHGRKIAIRKSIDQKILGGFVVKLDDKILDSSLSARINNLRNILKN